MFKNLKNKLKGFFGKTEESKEKTEKKEEKKIEKAIKKEAKKKIKTSEKKEEKSKETTPEPTPEPTESEQEPSEEKEKTKSSFFSKIIKGTTTLKQEHLDSIFEPLEMILLENNVNLSTIDKIKSNLEKDLIGVETKKADIEKTIRKSLSNSIKEVLIEPLNLIEKIKNKKLEPYTIIFFGINGSGKTTSIAKLAHKLKKAGIKPVMAAADTFRAASIEQLKIHGKKLDIPVIAHDYNSDPAAVAFDAKDYAKKHKLNCVLIDTAGRMYTKSNLMKEMEKIIRVSKPDLKIFVAEYITGNDATEQAKTFNEAVGIDGTILTKADVDEKGGAALSISQVTGKPIYFLGTGQGYNNLEDFKKDKIIKNLGLE